MSGAAMEIGSKVASPGSNVGTRHTGTIKFFNPDRGYGFIRREGGQDVFVHANELRKSGIVDLEPVQTGAKLEFAVEMVPEKGPKATSIVMLPTDTL